MKCGANMDKKRKKILFIVPSLFGGGSERVLLTLLTHIDREKFEPVLVVVNTQGVLGKFKKNIPADIKFIDLKAAQLRYAVFKIIKVIKLSKPDMVFSMLGHLNLLFAMLRPFLSKNITFIARESNTVSSHNQDERYPKLFDWLFSKFYNNLDLIINQSEYMKNDLVQNYNTDEKKIKVINNPVDIEKIEKLSSESTGNLFDERKINLLCVGKLEHAKGYDLLIKALTKLDDRFFITILGEGSQESALKEQAFKNGVLDKIAFIGFADNPYAYMKQADLLILSSRYEGLPNVVLEANACGTPVVAFNAPGVNCEVIKNGFNGFLVEDFDTDKMAQKIAGASKFKFNYEEIKQECKRKYAVLKIVKKYEDLFLDF